MGQKLGDLLKWASLEGDGKRGAHFPGNARSVVLEVNAPRETAVYVEYEIEDKDEDGNVVGAHEKEQFLALVKGRDRLEFTVPGGFTMWSDDDLLYYASEEQVVWNVDVAPLIFTRIANRKVRNRNVEMIEWQMRQNLERRMAEMEEEALRRIRDKVNAYAPQRNFKPPFVDDGLPPETNEDGDDEPSPRNPAAVAKDEGKGGKAGKGGKQSPPATADD